ncbi:MAG TPA: DUF192 domain-containing protein [Actinomycetota bacterium]|nr:DUF192 domain-containing protein [Actinomycetota bacterium]
MPVRLVVPSTGRVIARNLRRAATPRERARGLLRGPPLGAGEALVLEPARQVHTFGMRHPVDVCFCDRAWRVLHVVTPLRPRRVTRWVFRARFAIEMRPGGLAGLQEGDQLSVEELNDR